MCLLTCPLFLWKIGHIAGVGITKEKTGRLESHRPGAPPLLELKLETGYEGADPAGRPLRWRSTTAATRAHRKARPEARIPAARATPARKASRLRARPIASCAMRWCMPPRCRLPVAQVACPD